jgi:hypothetical protein
MYNMTDKSGKSWGLQYPSGFKKGQGGVGEEIKRREEEFRKKEEERRKKA